MIPVALSLRTLRRDWRSGELRLLAIALIIAVTSVTSIDFFNDRIRRAIQNQTHSLLGGDLVLKSGQPIAEQIVDKAKSLHLEVSRTLSFSSVIVLNDQLQLAEVKAVDDKYPLLGSLRISDQLFAQEHETRQIPQPGNVWPGQRLMMQLGAVVGDTLQLGNSTFTISRVLTFEPDRGGELFHIAPRLLLNIEDISSTGLIQPGSRLGYRLPITGSTDDLSKFRRWIATRSDDNLKTLSLKDARPELRATLQRSSQFLALGALINVMLAGIAIAMAVRRFIMRHLDNVALLRCLGFSQRRIMMLFSLEMLYLGILASLCGCLLGYGVQFGLSSLLADLTSANLPAPSPRPVATGLLTGLITLFGFAVPPLLVLRSVSPARVLRRSPASPPGMTWPAPVTAITAIVLLLVWRNDDAELTLYMIAIATTTIILLVAVAWLLIKSISWTGLRTGTGWRYGVTSVLRRANASVVQSVALGLGIMVMLLLLIIRTDLLVEWRATLPTDAANQFIINIQPDQLEAIGNFFQEHGLARPVLYPMVRGRLTSINDKTIRIEDYSDSRARRLAEREFNLSWARDLQSDNRIVAGSWWNTEPFSSRQLSVEVGIAGTLGIELGDTLTYRIGASEFKAPVTSLRTVEWDSFKANFFVLSPPGLLEEFPGTWITSFHLKPTDKRFLIDLVTAFPSISALDVDALMNHARGLIKRATHAVEFVFLFTVLAGVVVLITAIQTSHDERKQETAMLLTFGARRRQILAGLLSEFITLGTVAGLTGATAAIVAAFILTRQILGFSYQASPEIFFIGIIAGASGVGIAGLLGARRLLDTPPAQALRQL